MSRTSPSPQQWAIFAGGMVALIWLVVRVKAYLTESNDSAACQQELQSSLEEMKRSGDLSDVEYRLIKSRLETPQTGSSDDANQNGKSRFDG